MAIHSSFSGKTQDKNALTDELEFMFYILIGRALHEANQIYLKTKN